VSPILDGGSTAPPEAGIQHPTEGAPAEVAAPAKEQPNVALPLPPIQQLFARGMVRDA
jgi:hypothetical protein